MSDWSSSSSLENSHQKNTHFEICKTCSHQVGVLLQVFRSRLAACKLARLKSTYSNHRNSQHCHQGTRGTWRSGLGSRKSSSTSLRRPASLERKIKKVTGRLCVRVRVAPWGTLLIVCCFMLFQLSRSEPALASMRQRVRLADHQLLSLADHRRSQPPGLQTWEQMLGTIAALK